MSETYTYEQSVHWMRAQPELRDLVSFCYLDEDVRAAAARFAASEEFQAIGKLVGMGPLPMPGRVLDIGCGNGIASFAFASLGHEVVAVDPDPSGDVGLNAAARLAGSVPSGHVVALRALAERLPFADSTFDLVYAHQALHHFGDLSRGIAECARVLRPGAILLATREHVVDNDDQLRAFLDRHVLHQLHGGECAHPVHIYTTALQQAGLHILRCFGPYDTVINHYPQPNSDIRDRVHRAIRKRLGRRAADLLSNTRPVMHWYRNRLSRADRSPGRLYSFLCRKKG